MPLSEQEQRLLDEMERHLMQNDADVVNASAEGRALSYRNLVIGALLVLLGLGALVAGVAMWQNVPIVGLIAGLAGFAAMVVGVVFAATPVKSTAGPQPREKTSKTVPGPSSFMDRMNDRWDRRQQDR